MKRKSIRCVVIGIVAGGINGLLGAGGGMLLVPMLSAFAQLEDHRVFPTSVAIIFPICLVSLIISPGLNALPWQKSWPYLLGAIPGGILAGILEKKIPVKWLHRALGILMLWGGLQYLC